MSFYTIPIDYLPAQDTNVDFVFKLTEVTIAKLTAPEQTSFWSDLAADAGNLRLFADAEKITGLPVEIVIVDTGTQVLEIWGRLNGPLLAAGGQNIYLETIVTGDPVLADVSDPLGQYAVWKDFTLVAHGVVDQSDSTNNYLPSFDIRGNAPTFSRALGMTLNDSIAFFNKRAAGELISRTNFTFTAQVDIEFIRDTNINSDRDGITLIGGSSLAQFDSQLVFFLQQEKPGEPPPPPPPGQPPLNGVFFGGTGIAFSGFDVNGALTGEPTRTFAGQVADPSRNFEGENFLISGSYDRTQNQFDYPGFLGEWRYYRDGIQEGFNTYFEGLPYGRSRIAETTYRLGFFENIWSIKELQIYSGTLNAAYQAAQQINRNDEINFFGLATVEPVNPPDPPPPPTPPGPPPTSDRDIQAW